MTRRSLAALEWAPAFTSAALEAEYRQLQAASIARLHVRGSYGLWLLYCGASIRYLRYMTARQLIPIATPWAMLLTLLTLTPALCARLGGRQGGGRLRVWCIAAFRLLAVGLLNRSFLEVLRSSSTEFPRTLPKQLALLILMARLPMIWFVAMVYRLPFFLHILVDGLIVWANMRGLALKCAALPLQPHGHAFFRSALRVLSGWARAWPAELALPSGGLVSSWPVCLKAAAATAAAAAAEGEEGGGGERDGCSCAVVLGMAMLMLGYVVPAMIIALAEIKGRCHFVAARLQQEQRRRQQGQRGGARAARDGNGSGDGPAGPEEGGGVGIPNGGFEREDLMRYVVHDWGAQAAKLLCLLPALLALSWAVVAVVAAPAPAAAA